METVTGLEGTELTFAANEEKALTAQEVQVSYTGAQDGSVTVPAEGTASFTVTVSLTAAGKRYLEENFENGTYVEGFTFLYAGEEDGIDLSLPFLGFYGDWANLDVFDADLGRDVNMAGTILGTLTTQAMAVIWVTTPSLGATMHPRCLSAPGRATAS